MKEQAYMVFVDIWRLAYRYQFQKMTDDQWAEFIKMGKEGMGRYRGTSVEHLYRNLFMAVQSFYEKF